MTKYTAIFYEHHHCSKPDATAEYPNVWGAITYLNCAFEVVVVSWLGGMHITVDAPE